MVVQSVTHSETLHGLVSLLSPRFRHAHNRVPSGLLDPVEKLQKNRAFSVLPTSLCVCGDSENLFWRPVLCVLNVVVTWSGISACAAFRTIEVAVLAGAGGVSLAFTTNSLHMSEIKKMNTAKACAPMCRTCMNQTVDPSVPRFIPHCVVLLQNSVLLDVHFTCVHCVTWIQTRSVRFFL